MTWRIRLVALGAVAVTACAPTASRTGDGAAAPERVAPKNIVAISSGNPPGLDNRFVVSSNNANRVAVPLYASKLIIADTAEGNRQAQLAEAVPSIDNGLWKVNSDNSMETRLTLRAGAAWHDGAPVTTRDILFNQEVYADKTLPQIVESAQQYVSKIEAVDDRTIAISWKQPYILADVFSPDMMPAHILEESFRASHESVTTHPWLASEYVGNGPFKLKQFEPGAFMVLTAFEKYALGRPKLDEITLKFIPDGNTMMANVVAGGSDITLSSTPSVDQAFQLKEQGWDGQIGDFSTNWVHFFVQHIDPVNPVLATKPFKQGLMFALNRQEYVDTIQHGWGGVAEIPLLPADPNFNTILSQVDRYPYDPRRAIERFAEAGLAKGPDGFLHFTATGQKLETIEFRTTAEQDVQVRLLAAMSDDFKGAGLDINQVPIPQVRTADRPYRVSNPGFEVLSGGLGPAFLIGWMHSSKVPTAANNYTSGNYPRFANAQWDSLIDRYAVTIPQDARLQLETEIIKFLTDNITDVGVIYSTHPQFASKRMVVPQQRSLWAPETWDLR